MINFNLLNVDKGGLVKASQSVFLICDCTEKCIQRILTNTAGKLPQVSNHLICTIRLSVWADLGSKVFFGLYDHMFDCDAKRNHVFKLIKHVSQSYIKIRMH